MIYYLKLYNPEKDNGGEFIDSFNYEFNIEPIPVLDGVNLVYRDDNAIKFIEDEAPLRNLVPLQLYRDQAMTSLVKDWGEQKEQKFNALRRAYHIALSKIN